jgi:3-isopropylmalate dehydratase small subunit
MVLKFHEAPHTAAQLYGVPHVILRVFNTIFYENEFQNPQIFQQTISFFPEQTLDRK